MSWQTNPRINSLIGPARTKELVILGEDLLGKKAFEWGRPKEFVRMEKPLMCLWNLQKSK